ncbi:DUF305 domain-containing protein [Agromyces sp. LHK192]|uniref:DUF305 domain-containing protein n=1 Tax=Agromyces sp. LHK192 TaxID=2498704 RepID=UPI000FDC33A1|nr:DUF305 domain-containing protein [Agromyces sp. LHK192]
MTSGDEGAGTAASATSPPDAAAPESTGSTGRRPARLAAIVAAGVVVLVIATVAFSFGRLSTLSSPTPTDRGADAGFARDMQVHHLQGVELAMLVRDRSEADDIRHLSYDIATSQAQQAGQMYGWLEEWGLSQAGSEPSMTWMTRPAKDGSAHDHSDAAGGPGAHAPGEPMPGLATPEQVARLEAATGVEAERIFLELMIAHHRGAVEMAEAALDRADAPVVLSLARAIVGSQSAEIDLMEGMLAERGGPPEPPTTTTP